MICTTWGPWQR